MNCTRFKIITLLDTASQPGKYTAMASTPVSEHVTETMDYLNDAAHLMRTMAPHTSAHLMSVRNSFSGHNGVSPTDVQRQHACGGCGHIMMPGDANGTTVKLQRRPQLQNKKGHPIQKKSQTITTPSPGPIKVLSCGFCGRQTTTSFGLPPAAAAAARRKVGKPREKQAKPTDTKEPPKATANVNSKKRAKNRKAGLQALLSGQQQQRSSGLSLADFMNK
jgi:hypothetical protein